MFCHKCGYKLTNNNKCNNCGVVSEKIEVCGGFWGLVGEERKEPAGEIPYPGSIVVEDKELVGKVERLSEKIDTLEHKQQKSIYVAYGLLTVIIVLLVFSNILLISKLGDIKDFNKKYFKNLEDVLITESVSEEMTTVTEKHTVQEETTTELVTTEEETTEEETTESETTVLEETTEASSAESKTTTLEPTTTEPITLETQTIS